MGAQGQGWDYARQRALEAEELGFDSVWLPDHVINAHMEMRLPMLENWTVLAALGALTKRVTFAGHTFNNSLRHPAVLAKMAANFDVCSGRRTIGRIFSGTCNRSVSNHTDFSLRSARSKAS